MKTVFLFIVTLAGGAISISFVNDKPKTQAFNLSFNRLSSSTSLEVRAEKFNAYTQSTYECLNDSSINFEAFQYGMKGYQALKNLGQLNDKEQFVLIDFTKSSNDKRFYLIDLENDSVRYKKLVAHGRNTGELYAKDFSNVSESHKSSLGFYVTAETYNGKYDNSLIIEGKEWTNNQARRRGVVVHAADYATQNFIDKYGRLGRSYGCPALPPKDYKEIISTIKEGTCFFIYYNDNNYLKKSKFLKKELYLKTFH